MTPLRHTFAAILVGLLPASVALLAAMPASAHHGWSTFETRHAYFVKGTVSQVRWGNPHSEVRLKVTSTQVPANFQARELPPGADATSGRATLASARPYGGERRELRLVLAGPSWMARWGLNRPLQEGEEIEVVGYLNASEDVELRPMMFWLRGGQGVWQQLTALPQAPEPAPAAR